MEEIDGKATSCSILHIHTYIVGAKLFNQKPETESRR